MPARFPAIMDETAFAFSVARVRALETRLLDRQRFERMLDAADAGEVYRMLSETEYSEALAASSDVHHFEDALGRELVRVYQYLSKFVPERAVLDCVLVRYDFHNLKVLTKELLLGETPAEGALYQVGTIGLTALREAVRAALSGAGSKIEPAFSECVKEAAKVYQATSDPECIDNIIDTAMFQFGTHLAKGSKSKMLLELWQAWADLANLKSFVRALAFFRERDFLKRVLVLGGLIAPAELLAIYEQSPSAIDTLMAFAAKTRYHSVVHNGFKDFRASKSFSLYEKLADNFVLSILARAKYISLGFEPIVAYLLAKENEIKNVRIILTGKINRLGADAIRERLRDAYV